MIAIQMSGNMTGAVKKIEKIMTGLSDDDQVAAALRLANENKIVKEDIDKAYDDLHDALVYTDKMLKQKGYRKEHRKFKQWWNELDEFYPSIQGEIKEANIKDKDVILSAALGEFLETEMDIRKALVKDKRVAKHIGKWDKADLEVYFDDDELVAGGDSGATIVRVKGDMTLGDLKKAILKKNPKLWKEAIKENTPLQVKMGAYTNVLHALEKYSKILNKAKETKKAKLAMKMMKNLQKSFFANEQWIGELKHPRSTELLDDIKQKVAKLLRIASGEHSDKVFDKLKSSKKALKAAEKLLGKIS